MNKKKMLDERWDELVHVYSLLLYNRFISDNKPPLNTDKIT